MLVQYIANKETANTMARLIRPLKHLPQLQHHRSFHRPKNHILSSIFLPTISSTDTISLYCISITSLPSSHRNLHHRSQGLKPRNAPTFSDTQDDETSDSESEFKKSRNQKKREARRAVRWGMQLAAFSTPQIKRILRVASLDEDVFEALMLVKRLGPDVKEGKRRQYNYIGKLLRDAEPELIESLIEATKVGDHGTLQALAASKMQIIGADDEEEKPEVLEDDEEEEDLHEHMNIATRWFDGLVDKDTKITNEIYSLQNVDFDRQELRKLVKQVHASQTTIEGNEGKLDPATLRAKKSLTRFLRNLAKRVSIE